MDEIEQIVATARQRGYSDQEIQATLKSKGIEWSPTPAAAAMPPDTEALAKTARDRGYNEMEIRNRLSAAGIDYNPDPSKMDYARAAGMGATFGFLDELAGAGAALVPGGKGYTEARDDVRANYEASKQANPKRMLAAEVGGGLVSTLAGGGLLGAAGKALGIGANAVKATGTAAKALKAAKVGSATGAVTGLGYSTDNPVTGTLGGAVAGGVLGGGAQLVGGALGGAGRYLGDVANPGRAITREAATQLADVDAAGIIARQNKLAPGTAIQADMSPETVALMRGIGADATSAQTAKEFAKQRTQDLLSARKGLSARYSKFDGTKIALTPEADYVLRNNGILPTPTGKVDFKVVQKLRTKIREQLQATKKGSVKAELAPQKRVLDDILTQQVKGLAEVDSDYAFLTDRIDMAKLLHKEIKASSKNYAAQRAYGKDAGSIGGNLPSGSRGMVARLLEMLEPNRQDRARQAYHQLMRPGAAIPAFAGEQGGNGLLMPGFTGWAGGRLSGGLLGD